MHTDWATALPHPVGFVLSGGASLGAVQVGMLQALAEGGLEPDLVVGTSVGSLNAAIVAEYADLHDAVRVLADTRQSLRRQDVFPRGTMAAAWSVLRTGHLYSGGMPDALLLNAMAATRQRALVEAPMVAIRLPVLYLPRPCASNRSLLDLDSSAALIDPTTQVVRQFLAEVQAPSPGGWSALPMGTSMPWWGEVPVSARWPIRLPSRSRPRTRRRARRSAR